MDVAYGSESLSGLIQIEVDENDHPDFYKIEVPQEVQGLVFSSAELRRGCLGDDESYSIPLAMRPFNGVMKTQVFVASSEIGAWKINVGYLKARGKNSPIILDGPAIESWEYLKHNKFKNENAASGSDASSTRPF